MNIKELIRNNKLVIYTCIIGEYDYLKDPEYIDDNCDYICFTNNPKLKSNIWQIRFIENRDMNVTKWQRHYKLFPNIYLPEYDYSIYVDGNVRIIGSMREYIDKELKNAPMLCLKHPERTNPYDEAEECIRLKKADPDVIRAQMKGYQEEGFKGDTGLIVANILFRSHNDPAVIRVMKRWWHEIENKSQRDQLSFNYACWKEKFTYDLSELKCWRSPYWMNPGIHTSSLKKVEEELIEHIAVQEYQQYCIREKEKALYDAKQYISLKEKELYDANDYIRIKEEELSASIQRENELKKQIDRIHSMWIWKASKPIRTLYQKIRSK